VGEDCIAYFYQNYKDQESEEMQNIQHYCYITQGMDSKLNMLVEGVKVSYDSFILTKQGEVERILV